MNRVSIAAALCMLLLPMSAASQVYTFTEVDPLTTTFPHALPNGFSATGIGLTEMTGSYLRIDGGQLIVSIPITVTSANWRITVHYLHFPGCREREFFLIDESVHGFIGWIGDGRAYLDGVSTPFVSSPNTWYTMEVINDPVMNTTEMRVWRDGDPYPTAPTLSTTATGALIDLNLRAGNFCAPEKWVDYVSIEDQAVVPTRATTWGGVKALFH